MTKIAWEIPRSLSFSTEIEVDPAWLNHERRVGDVSIMKIANLARSKYLDSLGVDQNNLEKLNFRIISENVRYYGNLMCSNTVTASVGVIDCTKADILFGWRIKQSQFGNEFAAGISAFQIPNQVCLNSKDIQLLISQVA